jgi:hypothetical protein
MGNSMTESSIEIMDDFTTGRRQAWLLTPEDPRIERRIENGLLRIRNMIPSTAVTTVINLRSADYAKPIVIDSRLTLTEQSQTPSAAGIVFRYQSEDAYYVFAIDGMRRYSVWLRKAGEWQELRNLSDERWTFNEAINPPGQANTLRVIVNGATLIGFVNDTQVFNIQAEPQLMRGGVGIYTATTSNPNETAPLAAVDVASYNVRFYREEIPAATTVAILNQDDS